MGVPHLCVESHIPRRYEQAAEAAAEAGDLRLATLLAQPSQLEACQYLQKQVEAWSKTDSLDLMSSESVSLNALDFPIPYFLLRSHR